MNRLPANPSTSAQAHPGDTVFEKDFESAGTYLITLLVGFVMLLLPVMSAVGCDSTEDSTPDGEVEIDAAEVESDADTEQPPLDSLDDLEMTDTLDSEAEGEEDSSQDTTQDVDANEVIDLPDVPEVDQCGSDSPEGLMACVQRERYESDLTFVADMRPPGSTHWQAVQDLCFNTFTELGFEVELHDFTRGVNVIGTLRGTESPDELVIISAHYDHIEDCEGADDNASGIAGVLETARVLSEGSYERTLVVACWDLEEEGLLGSLTYAGRANSDGTNIIISYVFEMIGFKLDEPDSQSLPAGFGLLFPDSEAEIAANDYRGDFIALVADDFAIEPTLLMQVYAQAIGLRSPSLMLPQALKNSAAVADLRRSDHAAFWFHDFPAIMITDTGNFRNPHYHCRNGQDTIDTLDHGFATQVIQATVGSAAFMLKTR